VGAGVGVAVGAHAARSKETIMTATKATLDSFIDMVSLFPFQISLIMDLHKIAHISVLFITSSV
jgi:hypothetical protein